MSLAHFCAHKPFICEGDDMHVQVIIRRLIMQEQSRPSRLHAILIDDDLFSSLLNLSEQIEVGRPKVSDGLQSMGVDNCREILSSMGLVVRFEALWYQSSHRDIREH